MGEQQKGRRDVELELDRSDVLHNNGKIMFVDSCM